MVLSHSLTPFDLAQLAPVAALIPPRIQEPAVAMLTDFNRRLAGLGFYGPFQLRPVGAVIEDRAGNPFIHALPVVGPADQRHVAKIACRALNIACGFEAADTDTDTGPMADAAE